MHPLSASAVRRLDSYLARFRDSGEISEDSEVPGSSYRAYYFPTAQTTVRVEENGIDIATRTGTTHLLWRDLVKNKLSRPSIRDLHDAVSERAFTLIDSSFGRGMQGWSNFQAPGIVMSTLWDVVAYDWKQG